MRFALGADREALRDAARAVLQRLCTPSAVRDAWAGRPDRRAWEALEEMGALGVLTPESDGGLGLDETYLVPVLVEAGAVALAHPITETACVAAPLGVTGVPGGPAPLVSTDIGGALAPYAADADVFVLQEARSELRLYRAADVELEPIPTVDRSRRCARVRPCAEGELITDDPDEISAAFHRGALGAAAELVGLSRTMLDATVDYTSKRRQFGRPVGSFQAVKHHLADARLQLEFAVPAVHHAAHCLARRRLEPARDASRGVSQAKWLAGAAASAVGRAALQCHGAIGYTTESDLHLYLKRSWALARAWGDADFHADRVVESLGL